MTAVVGVLCRDGVVIGADSSVTFGQGPNIRIMEQPAQKLCVVEESILLAGTGAVGLDQRFCEVLKLAWNNKVFQKHPVEVGKFLSRAMIEDMSSTHLKPGQYGALVCFASNHKPQLCEFVMADFQPELKTEKIWYCSIGSTQYITDPFLGLMREVYWEETLPNIQDGIFAVAWALKHAVTLNVGGVNEPIHIGVLESEKGKYRARYVLREELEEVYQHIDETKKKMKEILSSFKDSEASVEAVPRRLN
jgi:20S proteasome alpha/beta subunit